MPIYETLLSSSGFFLLRDQFTLYLQTYLLSPLVALLQLIFPFLDCLCRLKTLYRQLGEHKSVIFNVFWVSFQGQSRRSTVNNRRHAVPYP